MKACRVCGSLVENCRCPACWKCGKVGEPSCNENHAFHGYLGAVKKVLAQAGGNYLEAADILGINNGHIYKALGEKRYFSPTLKKALRRHGYMRVRRGRFRLAVDFADDAERQAFRDEVLRGQSFTDWVMERAEGERTGGP